MVYTEQEKERMDLLLEAFREYVDHNPDFDIVYSAKAGFLRICVGEGADRIYFPIPDFQDMLSMFIEDFLQDEEVRVGHYLRRDYGHVRNLLTPILQNLGNDRDYALALLEQAFENCKRRCEQIHQDQLAMIRQTEELLENLRRSASV